MLHVASDRALDAFDDATLSHEPTEAQGLITTRSGTARLPAVAVAVLPSVVAKRR